jgi:hypothetical protein
MWRTLRAPRIAELNAPSSQARRSEHPESEHSKRSRVTARPIGLRGSHGPRSRHSVFASQCFQRERASARAAPRWHGSRFRAVHPPRRRYLQPVCHRRACWTNTTIQAPRLHVPPQNPGGSLRSHAPRRRRSFRAPLRAREIAKYSMLGSESPASWMMAVSMAVSRWWTPGMPRDGSSTASFTKASSSV